MVFELGEGPGEDLGRDSDFAKIVDHRRDPEALSPLRVQIQLLSDGGGQIGGVPLEPGGLGSLHLNDQGHGLNRGLSGPAELSKGATDFPGPFLDPSFQLSVGLSECLLGLFPLSKLPLDLLVKPGIINRNSCEVGEHVQKE